MLFSSFKFASVALFLAAAVNAAPASAGPQLVSRGYAVSHGNKVPTNLIDRRLVTGPGRLNDLCVERDVGILAYASLLGGFLSEKWLGQPEPSIDNLHSFPFNAMYVLVHALRPQWTARRRNRACSGAWVGLAVFTRSSRIARRIFSNSLTLQIGL